MTLDAETLFEHSREMLIQDECKFGYMVCEDHFAELRACHEIAVPDFCWIRGRIV